MEKNYGIGFIRLFIAMLMFAAVSLNLSDCQAAQWEWVLSTDTETVELDTSSVQRIAFPNAGNNVVCIIRVTAKDNSSVITKTALRIHNGNKESATMSCIIYDGNGNLIGEDVSVDEPYNYEVINPGSMGDTLYNKVMQYVE